MKTTLTSKFGNTFTTYTAKEPYKVSENGVRYFKQLVVWDNSRIGRVVHDRPVLIDKSQAVYRQK